MVRKPHSDVTATGPTFGPDQRTETFDGSTLSASQESTTELCRGDSVGRYLILDLLGQGGMGVVYAAYDPELDRKVAVKLLHSVERRAELQARLRREAQALARLSHPNLLGVYDVGRHGQQIFVAMELIRGTTLKHWLRSSPRSEAEILQAFLDVGEGLHAAHRAQVVHLDFKTSNVMAGDDGRMVVVDFGVARIIDRPVASPPNQTAGHGTTSQTTSEAGGGEIAGTPAFMAPEQLAGRRADARADQFSFCLCLFEALYGCRPFAGAAGDPASTEGEQWRVQLPSKTTISPSIQDALLRGLSVDPEHRFASMADLLSALRPVDRRPSSRRALVLATALSALALLVAFPFWRSYVERQGLCAAGDAKWQDTWHPARRAALASMFSSREELFAQDQWRSVEPLLDSYQKRWLDMYSETCRATHFSGEQSSELLDLRMGCLDQRRRELGALVDLLAEPDAERIEDAVDLVAGLTPLSECADVAALTSPIRPPDAGAARRVTDLRGQLAAAKVLHEGGELDAAAAELEPMDRQARELGYWPLIAEITLRRGRLQETLGSKTAAQLYRETLEASKVGRHDQVAVEAFIRLARWAGRQENDDERGLLYAAKAQALLDQLGRRPELEASIADQVGSIHFQQGRWDAALSSYRRALDIEGEGFDDHHPARARTLTRLGNAHREKGELKAALAAYRQALSIAEQAYGPSHPDVASALNRLGSMATAMGDPAAAETFLSRSLTIRNDVLGPTHPQVASSLIALGNVLTGRGDAPGGYARHRRALEILEANLGTEHPNLAIPLSGMATAAMSQDRFDEAGRCLDRAMELQSRAFGELHPRVATTVFNRGILFKEEGRFADALGEYRRALDIWRRLDFGRHAHVAAALTGVGHALTELGRAREALEPLREAVAMLEQLDIGPGPMARSRYRLARALAALGEAGEAKRLVSLAIEEFPRASELYAPLFEEARAWLEDSEEPSD